MTFVDLPGDLLSRKESVEGQDQGRIIFGAVMLAFAGARGVFCQSSRRKFNAVLPKANNNYVCAKLVGVLPTRNVAVYSIKGIFEQNRT